MLLYYNISYLLLLYTNNNMRIKTTKKEYSPVDIITARHYMNLNKVEGYKHIGKVKLVVGYSLIAYGVVGVDLGLSMWVGCAMLGIPTKTIRTQGKHWGRKALFVGGVLASPNRLRYELKRIYLKNLGTIGRKNYMKTLLE